MGHAVAVRGAARASCCNTVAQLLSTQRQPSHPIDGPTLGDYVDPTDTQNIMGDSTNTATAFAASNGPQLSAEASVED
jgi:hypothetical protein